MLDIKSAYQCLLREKLMVRLSRKVSTSLTAHYLLMLVPNSVSTVGCTEQHTRMMNQVVTQGSPLPPSLFNAYIDELEEWVDILGISYEAVVTLFADDSFFAKNARILLEFLNLCGQWAQLYELQWSIDKYILLLLPDEHQRWLWLNQSKVNRKEVAEYPGISLIYGNFSYKCYLECITAADQAMKMIQKSFKRSFLFMTAKRELIRVFTLPNSSTP